MSPWVSQCSRNPFRLQITRQAAMPDSASYTDTIPQISNKQLLPKALSQLPEVTPKLPILPFPAGFCPGILTGLHCSRVQQRARQLGDLSPVRQREDQHELLAVSLNSWHLRGQSAGQGLICCWAVAALCTLPRMALDTCSIPSTSDQQPGQVQEPMCTRSHVHGG